jgi:hypothetical protein
MASGAEFRGYRLQTASVTAAVIDVVDLHGRDRELGVRGLCLERAFNELRELRPDREIDLRAQAHDALSAVLDDRVFGAEIAPQERRTLQGTHFRSWF